MQLPKFFEQVPHLRVYDPLAELLGSAEGGVLEYGYGDAVRLAGHSCPTVAAAYWLTLRALHRLYPGALPRRGGVKVEFREEGHHGSTGVVAAVVQMLTGAANDEGFKGLAGSHGRAGLRRYAPELPLAMRYTRLDNGAAVDAEADLDLLPQPPELQPLLETCARGRGDASALRRLAELWQQRVRRLLLEFRDDDGVFIVRPAERAVQRQMMSAPA